MNIREIKKLIRKIVSEDLGDLMINETRFSAQDLASTIRDIRTKYFSDTEELSFPPVDTQTGKEFKSYTVVKGDTLGKIAARNNMPLQDLIDANPQIDNVDVIEIGDEVYIPGESDTERPKPEKDPVRPDPDSTEAESRSGLDLSFPYVLPFALSSSKFAGLYISGFGSRRSGNHLGVDYFLPIGVPVYAIADGKVMSTGFVDEGKYEKLTNWLVDTIKKKYGIEDVLRGGDHKDFYLNISKQKIIAKKENVEDWRDYYKKVRRLFETEKDSPFKHLKKPADGRWHAGISFKINHRGLKDNPKNLRTSRYLHLNDAYVKPGQTVKKGQIIGTVGRTGCLDAKAHLHLEIKNTENKLQPEAWLRDFEYVGTTDRQPAVATLRKKSPEKT